MNQCSARNVKCCVMLSLEPFLDLLTEELLWTEKYQPQHSSDIIGNTASVRKLHRSVSPWSALLPLYTPVWPPFLCAPLGLLTHRHQTSVVSGDGDRRSPFFRSRPCSFIWRLAIIREKQIGSLSPPALYRRLSPPRSWPSFSLTAPHSGFD